MMYPAAASSASRRRSSSYRSRRLSWNSQPSHFERRSACRSNQKSTSYPRMRAWNSRPGKVVLPRQRPHPALELAVECSPSITHSSSAAPRAPGRRAARARMHADRRVQRDRRSEPIRDDVTDRRDDAARIHGAEVAQHAQMFAVAMPWQTRGVRSRRSRGRCTTTPSSVASRLRSTSISSVGSSSGRGIPHSSRPTGATPCAPRPAASTAAAIICSRVCRLPYRRATPGSRREHPVGIALVPRRRARPRDVSAAHA